MSDLQQWIGREERIADQMDPWRAEALAATLDLGARTERAPAVLPPLWHWIYFIETAPRRNIDRDGHPKRGDFLPPVDLPRRMFAGGRLVFRHALTLGEPAELIQRVAKIDEKTGRSGRLVVVTVAYLYRQGAQTAIEEERDFVYLEPAPSRSQIAPEERPVAVPDAPWRLDITPDPVLLFRFSALTFNSHRIHYDARYAHDEEGYRRLVVHGPLTALLLGETIRRNADRMLADFHFRASNPLFEGEEIRIRGAAEGQRASVTAFTPDGKPAIIAEASFAEPH